MLLREIDQLRPENFLSSSDFISSFSTTVNEYDSIASVALDPVMKKLKLLRCIAGNDCLVNAISTLHIAAKAAASPAPSYNDHISALNQAYNNIKIAFDPSKVCTKSTNRRKKIMKALVDGGANGGIAGTEDL